MQEKPQSTREGPDNYTDTKPSVIEKRAGRRPALPNAREASDHKGMHRQVHRLQAKCDQKRAGRRPALPNAREVSDHKGRPRQVHIYKAKCDSKTILYHYSIYLEIRCIIVSSFSQTSLVVSVLVWASPCGLVLLLLLLELAFGQLLLITLGLVSVCLSGPSLVV